MLSRDMFPVSSLEDGSTLCTTEKGDQFYRVRADGSRDRLSLADAARLLQRAGSTGPVGPTADPFRTALAQALGVDPDGVALPMAEPQPQTSRAPSRRRSARKRTRSATDPIPCPHCGEDVRSAAAIRALGRRLAAAEQERDAMVERYGELLHLVTGVDGSGSEPPRTGSPPGRGRSKGKG
jgi:hypothetical protein